MPVKLRHNRERFIKACSDHSYGATCADKTLSFGGRGQRLCPNSQVDMVFKFPDA